MGPAEIVTNSPEPQSSIYLDLELSKEPNSESIRLLELAPGDSGKLIATIFCVTSPRERAYDALSYRWGDSERTDSITVNGCLVGITKNLDRALSSLRLPDRPRLLWVDALCINQSDNAEKATQVARMGAIYRHAETVAIFLGMPKARSYHLFDFLERVGEHAATTGDNTEDVITACGMDTVAVLESFVEFCRRDWWTRVWVMQEYYVAAREPRWYIGRRHVGGDRLCREIRALATAAVRVFSPFGQQKDVSARVGVRTIGSFVDMLLKVCDGALMRQHTKPYNTPRLFYAKHGRLATDPRDHIYGARELLEPHFRQVFVPSYHLGTGPLFERLAAWLLLMDGWGDMLWYYPLRPAVENGVALPSWVPDFAQRPPMLVNEREPPKYEADDPKTVHCAIVDRRLYLDGCLLDVIEEVFPLPDGDRWDVLQRVWQLDRIFCSNQRGGAPAPDTEWSDRTLLAWATTMRPTTSPLAPRRRGSVPSVDDGFQQHLKVVEAKALSLMEACKVEATASSESETSEERYSRVSADILASYKEEIRGVGTLHAFLTQQMEGDFASACAFDFDNISSQLDAAFAAPDAARGIESILAAAGPRDVVYADLLRAIEKNSCGGESFRTLVSVVRDAAKRIHGGRNLPVRHHFSDNAEEKIRLIRFHLEEQQAELEKAKLSQAVTSDSAEAREKKERHVLGLERDISDAENALAFATGHENIERRNRIDHAEDWSWERLDEEKAAQFRGREFFCTPSGLCGLASPGVRGIQPGDSVFLIDGLSFPLITRCRGKSTLGVVGCATVRGVELRHTVEEAVLASGIIPGPRQTLTVV